MALAIENNEETRFRRRAERMLVESLCEDGEKVQDENAGSKVLALAHSYTLPRNRSSNPSPRFSSHPAAFLSTLETKNAPSDPSSPSPASFYFTSPPTPERFSHCNLCLGPHAVCRLVSEVDRDRFIRVREKNFQARHLELQH